ncbi:Os07g0277900 [Oryza sativa Japonica Group]|uniref:Os07g0277900 protein n=1 Tax=Oryza sativa subsp. japonica TaxID=39947 RepID=C7J540_ORYSJ|nr:Os07g0277900 [Oryza sativa Japonica Group]|eukprot:NP_001175138.1 Os07g0277900 [Oryza sativa Japonica Group]
MAADPPCKEVEQAVTPWEVSAPGGGRHHRLRKNGGPLRLQPPRRRAHRLHRSPHLPPAASLPPPRDLLRSPVFFCS